MYAWTVDDVTPEEQMFDQNPRGVSAHPPYLTQFRFEQAATWMF